MELYLTGTSSRLEAPRFGGSVDYDAQKRTGVCISRLGTGKAACIGAAVYGLTRLG
jgi:hypothetical protein